MGASFCRWCWQTHSTPYANSSRLYQVHLICIIAYILTSGFAPYNVTLNRIQRSLYDIVDPYLRLFRRFLPHFGSGA